MTTRRWAFAWAWTIGVVLSAGSVGAQEPPPKPPCDPLEAPCYAAEGWLLTERSWTPGGAKPRDLVGGRLQAEVRWHRWRVAARGDATGIPGEYQQGQWETIRSAEAHVAVAWGPVCPPGSISIGPAAAFGAALTIEHDDQGNKANLPKRVTAGIGLRASGPGWWLYAVLGQNQALRGVSATSVWQIAVSDRVANVGSLAIGAGGVYTGTFGVAVRFK